MLEQVIQYAQRLGYVTWRQVAKNPNLLTYSSVINVCTEADNIDTAGGWLAKIRKCDPVPDTVSYNTVIHACLRSHRPHVCACTFTTMELDWWLQVMLIPACGTILMCRIFNDMVTTWTSTSLSS